MHVLARVKEDNDSFLGSSRSQRTAITCLRRFKGMLACAAVAAKAAKVVADLASHPGMVGASLSSEVQYCYLLRSRVPPPPNAFMQFAQEKRRSVPAMNANENNWREPFQRKVAEAVADRRKKYPDYAHNPREAHRRKEQERIPKHVTSKLNNDSSWDKEQHPLISTVTAQGRGSRKFQLHLHPPPLPPTPRSKHHATISAAPVSASGAGQGTVVCIPTATVPDTTKHLEEQVVAAKVAALRALAELLKRQPPHFHSYAELTLIKRFGIFKQPEREVSRAAELCSIDAAAALPPEQAMRLLH
ncbi:hypothetical protein HPB49_009533 [Dermacentor silvarum]|uniref:Uncharacterized protein n=1 Tax=Dermacentor silvarum TaxID=543639 RepID=A0ACB8DYP7_DERSI|nr:hypothetical protein HPB49_009533 [Dermacentor silvarum]